MNEFEMKKEMKKEKKRFICVSESIRNGIKQGFCGDTHTLQEWIDILYGSKGTFYFDSAPEKEIIDYIRDFGGKRLVDETKFLGV